MLAFFYSFKEKYLKIFCLTFLLGFALYSPIAYQSLWNPDSLSRSVFVNDVIWVQQARWGCQLWEKFVRSYYIFPIMSMFISVLLLAAITIVIINIFEIENKIAQILIAVCVVASIQQISTMTYAYCGDEFTVAYFLAVCAAFFWNRNWSAGEKHTKNWLCGLMCMVMSLAMYQAYMEVTVVILGVMFVLKIFSEKKLVECVKTFFMQVVFLGISVIVYYISVRLSLIICHTQFSTYRDIEKMGKIDFSTIPSTVKNAYKSFYNYYFTNQLFNNSFRYKGLLNMIIMVCILVLMVFLAIERRKNLNLSKCVALMVCIILLPLGFNIVFFMTGTGVSFMMLPAIPYIYIILVILIERACEDGKLVFAIKCMRIPIALMAYTSILLANMLVLELRLDINKASSIANSIDQSIKANENYTRDTKVLIVGNYNKGNYESVYSNIFSETLGGTVSDFGQFWMGEGLGLANMNCWNHLFMQYCGSQYYMCSDEEYNKIVDSEEFANMDIYPQKDSIEMINDVLVIKLSDELY